MTTDPTRAAVNAFLAGRGPDDTFTLDELCAWVAEHTATPVERIIRYGVSLLPEDHPDARLFTIAVGYVHKGLWSLHCYGLTYNKTIRDWDYAIPGDAEWRAAHQFPLDEALALARQLAPGIECNGRTALEAYQGVAATRK